MEQELNQDNMFTRAMSPVTLKVLIIVLFGLVFLSLGLNWYLISQLLQVQRQAEEAMQEFKPVAQDALSRADEELAAFQNTTLEFDIAIDQELPINVKIPFAETLEIPIDVVIPVKKQVRTTILIDPLQSGFEIPVDIVVPVNEEIPINMVLPIEIERTIPISIQVPIKLNVPIAVNVGDTDLVEYIEQLREGIARLNESLDTVVLPGQ